MNRGTLYKARKILNGLLTLTGDFAFEMRLLILLGINLHIVVSISSCCAKQIVATFRTPSLLQAASEKNSSKTSGVPRNNPVDLQLLNRHLPSSSKHPGQTVGKRQAASRAASRQNMLRAASGKIALHICLLNYST
jgi:hypothetical protein